MTMSKDRNESLLDRFSSPSIFTVHTVHCEAGISLAYINSSSSGPSDDGNVVVRPDNVAWMNGILVTDATGEGIFDVVKVNAVLLAQIRSISSRVQGGMGRQQDSGTRSTIARNNSLTVINTMSAFRFYSGSEDEIKSRAPVVQQMRMSDARVEEYKRVIA